MNLVLIGLILGIVFGFILQRGRFCMNSAFRDVVLLKDFTLLKSVGAAVLVMLVGFSILAATGMIELAPKPLMWIASIVGAFIFGIGMVLAGGCASGITYRMGEGMVGAITAVLGLTMAGWWTAGGFLKGIKDTLQQVDAEGNAAAQKLTLHGLLNMDYLVIALVIAIVAAVVWFLLARGKEDEEMWGASSGTLFEKIFKNGWGWLTTGLLIGIVGIVNFLAVKGPLGITKGWIVIEKNIIGKAEDLHWMSGLVIGIIIGAFIAAIIAGEFKFRVPKVGVLVQTFIGGCLMGFGAVTSGGCNVTHVLSGIPQLSIGSMVSAVFLIAGAWATAWFMFVRPQK